MTENRAAIPRSRQKIQNELKKNGSSAFMNFKCPDCFAWRESRAQAKCPHAERPKCRLQVTPQWARSETWLAESSLPS